MWHNQRGSVYLGYALLAFAIAITGSLLVSVHKAFGLLLPVAVLVFFLPNLMGLWARLQATIQFRRQLAQARHSFSKSTILLKNGQGNINAQAVWLDPERNEFGFISGDHDLIVKAFDGLQKVRIVYNEAACATSFHQGRVRIPPRYALVFEFGDGTSHDFITLKQRRLHKWLAKLEQVVGARLQSEARRDSSMMEESNH